MSLTRRIGSLNLHGVDEFGAEWIAEDVTGWGVPASSREFTQKPRQSGAWASAGYSKNRDVAVNGVITSSSTAVTAAALDRLYAVVAAGAVPLTIDEGTGPRWTMVEQTDEIIPTWLGDTSVRYSFQVASTDWRKFGESLSGSTKLPSTTGGLTVPFTVPFSINATTVTGQVSLTNTGNESGPVTLRIDGPCTGPIVTHQPSGRVLAFSSSLALQAGEFLLIDMDARTALANGQANRAGYITSRGWSSFRPGANTWSFTAAQYNASSQLTVTAVPAWR